VGLTEPHATGAGSARAALPIVMFGIGTTPLEPDADLDDETSGGGGRLEEKAAGSGGAIRPESGVESNRSLSTSCVTGTFISKSRKLELALSAFGSTPRAAALALCSNGMSSAIGSISSVRSSPPYGTPAP
jgi:hypothetical protein